MQSTAPVQNTPLLPLEPFNTTGFYEVAWSGITAGGMVIDAFEDDTSYRMQVNVKSNGIAWAFTKHESSTTLEGIKTADIYVPQKFETYFKLRGKTRHIVLDYDAQGNLVHEINTPPENRDKRPAVPMELKKNVVDALTPFFLQRHKVYEALRNGQQKFTIRMYDGRRLTDMHYFVQGRKQVGWNMQDIPVIHFSMSRTPVAGYKDSELEDIANKKDPSVSLYLSDDGRLIPLKIVVDTTAGNFYANFKHACDTMAACVKHLNK
ncbi:MAG: DUF3108 domain-containing protein [Alphaproteobacteria bacterium]|nr:DUF3108 domain-containing protein [Alphaproteobacteria bacterium]